MNLLVGQNLAGGALSGNSTLAAVVRSDEQTFDLPSCEGLKASNRFARLLRSVEVQSGQLDFSCSGHFEGHLNEKADLLVVKLEAALMGIVTRVDVDNLCLLKLCVNALVVEGLEVSALKYATFARQWCGRADFTDTIATGNAFTATAEMYCRLKRYEVAAQFFRESTAAFEAVLDYEHPLTTYSRKRYKMTLTKLALGGRNKNTATYGAGYLRTAEQANYCPLVWDGSSL